MKAVRAFVGVIAMAASFSAAAQNLLNNGSFEAGTAGWTVVESGPFSPGNCVFESLAAGVPTGGAGAWVTPAPTDPTQVGMSDANAPGTCQIFQDVVVPTGAGILSFAAGYNFAPLGAPAGAGCAMSVQVLTPANAVIAQGFTATGGTNRPLTARPSVGFSGLAPGATVRVSITVDSCNDGPAGMAMDNMVLLAVPNVVATKVPTLSEWAMILMALLMAATAFLALRRR